ncbi:hypothetical protein [Bradyrhizobium sp. HKCCYLS20291]|uniref:hypothetical protein n=1 Tax=Bradyrhizobium sp. HKCCYLS20291 TaxID=3420766 RepID=UPI003EB878B3
MSIAIKLDAPALTKLIDDDSAFKLELQRAVIAEVTRKIYMKDVVGDMERLVHAAFHQHKTDLIQAVKEDEAVRAYIDERLSSLVRSIRGGAWGYVQQKELSDDLKGKVNIFVDGKVREECERQLGKVSKIVEDQAKMVQEQVMTRLGKISGYIEHNVKVEMLKQIQADVAKTIASTLGVKS